MAKTTERGWMTLAAWRRRRARGRRRATAAACAAMLAAAIGGRAADVAWSSDPMRRYDGRAFHVVRVIDGDTFDVAAADRRSPGDGGRGTRVRLWGVDTPELARPEWGRPAEPGAEAARDAVERLVAQSGDRVVLRLEPYRLRDGFGRLLAHVETTGGVSVQRALLDAGLARADTRWHHAELDRHAASEKAARDRGVGLWAE